MDCIRKSYRLFLLVLISLFLQFGCASVAPSLNDAVPTSSSVLSSSQKNSTENNNDYRLGAGDTLSIKFFYNSELNEDISIRPDGKSSLQLIGDILMAGLTTAELREELIKRYTGIIKFPEISVIVRSYESQKIYVGGEVSKPGIYDNTQGLTVAQAVFAAGGYKASAATSSVVIIRDKGESKPKHYIINLNAALNAENKGRNFQLAARDVIYVPPTHITSINQVVQPILAMLGNFNISLFYNYREL